MPTRAMSKPRKILYFINDLFGGGAQKGLVNILDVNFFEETELHVAAISRGDGCIKADLLRHLPASQVHVFTASEKMHLSHLLKAFLLYPLLLLKLRPRLVIMSLPQANIVGRFWGHILPITRLYAFEHTTSYAKKGYAYILTALSLSVRGIIMDTQTTGTETTRFFLPFKKYQIINLPLYTGALDSAYIKQGTAIKGKPTLLIAGRLTTAKNHINLFHALKLLATSGQPCHLNIAGSGELSDMLEAEVKKLGLQQHVTFLGYLSPWTTECAKADIYIQPSLREGLCITVVEAMRHGLPVIASPRGGMLDYGVDGENILFADPDSPEAIANAISKLVQDDKLRKKLAENAITSMESRFGTVALRQKLAAARAALKA
ncbi:MAG: glycosyltransferase family 1 protein [Alphaproteobacteria bacterium]|nr:MAG: glycosyltransferase family 1 protein [Alphaproteobacteria bacterium]